MGGLSFSHMVLLLVIVLVIFGAGKLPRVMGDIAKGMKAFKDGMKEGETSDKPSCFEKGMTALPDRQGNRISCKTGII